MSLHNPLGRFAPLTLRIACVAAPLLTAGIAKAQGPTAPASPPAPADATPQAASPALPAPPHHPANPGSPLPPPPPPPPPPGAFAAPPPPPPPGGETSVTLGTHTCLVGDHEGFDDADARTTTLLVCREVERKNPASSLYEVRFDKLGGKILLSVVDKQSGQSREMLVSGFEEIPVASPRIVDALIDNTSLTATGTVANVAGEEARPARVKPGQVSFDMGINAMTGIGTTFSASGGVGMGLNFRMDRLAVTSHGRLGGIGSSDNKLSSAALDVGGRYYFSDADFAPFAGGGFQFAFFNARRDTAPDVDGSGLAAFGEVGVEAMRTGRIGLIASLRADIPFFSLSHGASSRYDAVTGAYTPISGESTYVLPVSLNLGLVFR